MPGTFYDTTKMVAHSHRYFAVSFWNIRCVRRIGGCTLYLYAILAGCCLTGVADVVFYALLLIGLFSAPALSTTYYVSKAGSDSNDGLSPQRPWETISKVNSSRFSPSDQILFQRGNTWDEMLIPPSGGAVDGPIAFGAYGNGPKPIVDAQNSMNHAVTIRGTGFVVLDGLQFQNITFTSHGESLIQVLNSPHVTIKNCTFTSYHVGAAIFLDSGSPYLVVDNNIGTKGVGSNGRFLTSTITTTSDNPVVSNNVIDDPGDRVLHQIGVFDVNNADFHGNTVYGGGIAAQLHVCFRSLTGKIYDNYLVGAARADEGDNEIVELTGRNDGGTAGTCTPGDGKGNNFTVTADVYHNFLLFTHHTFNGIAGQLAINSRIYGNLIINEVGAGDGNAITFTYRSVNNVVYHNSIFDPHGYAFGFANNGCCTTVKNNLVKGRIYSTAEPANVVDDYNITTAVRTGGAGQGVSKGAHSRLNTDPQFVSTNPTGPDDFKLRDTSPACHAGTRLGHPFNMALDPQSSFPYSKVDLDKAEMGWDIGAFAH